MRVKEIAGAVAGPTTTSLAITSPSRLSSTTPVIASNPSGGIVTFLGTSVGAVDMKFFVDSTEQSRVRPPGPLARRYDTSLTSKLAPSGSANAPPISPRMWTT